MFQEFKEEVKEMENSENSSDNEIAHAGQAMPGVLRCSGAGG